MSLLEQYLEACRERSFNWLWWNCVHFTGGWLLQAEGSSAILDRYERNTETMLAAARYAKKLGGLRQSYTGALGRAPLPPLAARPGDIVLFEDVSCSGAGTLGICNGVSAVTLHAVAGIDSRSMAGVSCAWRVNVLQ
jgi:hypothetical protein